MKKTQLILKEHNTNREYNLFSDKQQVDILEKVNEAITTFSSISEIKDYLKGTNLFLNKEEKVAHSIVNVIEVLEVKKNVFKINIS